MSDASVGIAVNIPLGGKPSVDVVVGDGNGNNLNLNINGSGDVNASVSHTDSNGINWNVTANSNGNVSGSASGTTGNGTKWEVTGDNKGNAGGSASGTTGDGTKWELTGDNKGNAGGSASGTTGDGTKWELTGDNKGNAGGSASGTTGDGTKWELTGDNKGNAGGSASGTTGDGTKWELTGDNKGNAGGSASGTAGDGTKWELTGDNKGNAGGSASGTTGDGTTWGVSASTKDQNGVPGTLDIRVNPDGSVTATGSSGGASGSSSTSGNMGDGGEAAEQPPSSMPYQDTGTSCSIDPTVNTAFSSASNFIQRSDPLTLDLDADGIETLSANSGITFDFNGDGLKTGTGWIKGDDALLVRDLDGNGRIDNGRELFGVDTVKRDGSKARDGFDAMRELDGNADGVFDAKDEHFASVRVWQDLNQDGVSQASELKTLSEHGIASIGLGSTATSQNSNGNLISATGSYTRSDGSQGSLANLDLASNPFYRQFTDRIATDATAKALPDMQGSGAVRDLREASMLSAGLKSVLGEYSAAETRQEQLALLDRVIAEWAGSSGYRTFDQRLSDMNSDDARFTFSYSWEVPLSDGSSSGIVPTQEQLQQKTVLEKVRLLEVFNAQEFFSFDSTENTDSTGSTRTEAFVRSGSINTGRSGNTRAAMATGPITIYVTEKHLTINSAQAEFLNSAYDSLRDSIYQGLLLQTRLKPYIDSINIVLGENGVDLDFSGFQNKLFEVAQSNASTAVVDLIDFKSISGLADDLSLELFDPLLTTYLEKLSQDQVDYVRGLLGVNATLLVGSNSTDLLKGSSQDNQLFGGAGNDILDGGTGSNRLYGGSGNDRLIVSGSAQDNLFVGGEGDDTLSGSYYSDTYVFNLGDGVDTLYETSIGYSHTDVLRFGDGIRTEDIQAQRVGQDLVFAHVNGQDKVIVKNAFNGTSSTSGTNSSALIERLEFADGTAMTWAQIAQKGLVQHGGAGNDSLIGYSGIDELHGGAGNDILDGGTGSNRLYGGSGNDRLTVSGSAQDNLFVGGEGDDTLSGSYYSDTYVFNLGDGVDTLYETSIGYSHTDVLRFGDGIRPEDIQAQRTGQDLVFAHVNGQDKVIVKNAFNGTSSTSGTNSSALIERLEFADGTAMTWAQIAQKGLVQHGGAGNDSLIGYSGIDELHGGAGNDTLDGGTGNDVLDGGAGNDYLDGGAGSDTYLFGKGSGQDTINNYDTSSSSLDTLLFGADVGVEDIWFRRSGSNLEVSIVGSSDKATLGNWYSGGNYHLDQFKTADGMTLLEGQVQSLVDAMAAFGVPAGGEGNLGAEQKLQLETVIAANWQ